MDPNSECYKTISKIKEILDAAGIEFNAMTCGLHGDPAFRNGALANPDPAVRELARLKVERAIRIGNRLNAKLFVYWVARDGFEVPVVTQWDKVYDWIADGLNHARDYMKENNFTKAIQAYTEAIKYAKQNGEDYELVYAYYQNRGACYLKTNQFAKAIPDFDYAIKLNPSNGAAYTNRGIAHYQTGNRAKALEDWRKAADLGISTALAYLKRSCTFGYGGKTWLLKYS